MRNPDGRLWLYDVENHTLKKITTGDASWPNWSRDSRYIYFFDNSGFERLRISDGKIDTIHPSEIKRGEETIGWTGVKPDGTFIATRDAGSTELYVLDWSQ